MVNRRRKELIKLAEKCASNLVESETNLNSNFIKEIAEQIHRSGFDMIKHITEKELKGIRTELEVNKWSLILGMVKKLINENKLSESEITLFLGFLAREVAFLSVCSSNDNSHTNQNQHKYRKKQSENNPFAKKLQEALKQQINKPKN